MINIFDYDDYLKNDREFYYKYDEVTPGPKASDWIDVIKYINMFIDNPEKYSHSRQTIADRFHVYQDSYSSRRIYKEITGLL